MACRLLHTLKGGSANISASRLQLLAGELEWRLRLQEELSEGELTQLQQVFIQTREEVSHFLLTGEQQESVAGGGSYSDPSPSGSACADPGRHMCSAGRFGRCGGAVRLP